MADDALQQEPQSQGFPSTIVPAPAQQQPLAQATPQDSFNQANALTSTITPTAIHQAYALNDQARADTQNAYDEYKKEMQEADLKRTPGKRSLSEIFMYGASPESHMRFIQDQDRKRQVADEGYARRLSNLMTTSKMLANRTPEELEASGKFAKQMSDIGKDHATAMKELQDANTLPNLREAQGKEALGAANWSNVHAEQYPKELQNKADETQVQAQKTYLDYDIANKKYQQDGTQQSYKEAQDARENFLKAVAANTEIKKLNNAEKVTATEQIKSDTGMVPKNPGYKVGVSKTINPMQFLTPPPRGVPVAGANTPQTDTILQSLAQRTGYPSVQGQAGHFAAPAPAGPPPSLLTPQPQQGNPITPTQTAAAGVGIPTAPPGGAGPAGNTAANQNAEPAINPTDIPIPFSLQQMMKNVPILNQQKAKIILDLYRGYVSQKHPEGPVLAAATNALKKLQAPVIGAK